MMLSTNTAWAGIMKRVSSCKFIGSSTLILGIVVGVHAGAAPVLQEESTSTPLRLEEPVDPGSAAERPLVEAPSAKAAGPQISASSALDATRAGEAGPGRANAGLRRQLPDARPALQSPSGVDSDAVEIDPDLKDAAKAALRLAHELEELAVPESLQSAASAATGRSAEAKPSTGDPSEGTGAAVEVAMPSVYLPATTQTNQGQINLIEEAKRLIAEVVEHPITMMLTPLLLFGLAAAGVVQYGGLARQRRSVRRSIQGRQETARPAHRRSRNGSNGPLESPPQPLTAAQGAVPEHHRRRSSSRRTGMG